ncbi:MAG: LacI family DNA-binding transcriptional regulator [Woeseia sp.]
MAEKAGVSKSTASQFLSGRFEYMSSDTRARIQQAVEELNYVPNNIARSLKTDTTRSIGVIVRDIAGFYTSHAIRGMDDFCKSHGYDMIIYNTDFEPATEARAIKSLGQLRVDGMIIASSGSNTELVSENSGRETPLVQFQLEHDDSDKDIILSDYRQAAFDATEYLIQLGHKRICFITQEYKSVKSRFERYQGYVDALNKYSIPIDEQLIQYWQRETGLRNSPKSILESSNAPTAFFAQHLAITVDLLKALDKADISIPDDVSVVGFDEIPMAEFFKVPITVVKQQPYVVGSEAAKLLINKIQNPEKDSKRIMVPCSLIVRDSCKRLSP